MRILRERLCVPFPDANVRSLSQDPRRVVGAVSVLRGLRSAAAKTHAWVFTAGTNSGASAIAGEALRQEAEDTGESHVVMGFAPWRRVHLHDKIEQHKKAMVLDCQSALA